MHYRELFSNQGDMTADFFCGSGGTAIAAMYLGRNSICVDNNQDMVTLTKNRVDKMRAEIADIQAAGDLPMLHFLANFKTFEDKSFVATEEAEEDLEDE